MKNMPSRTTKVLLGGLLLTTAISAYAAQAITFATEATYPPFVSMSPDQKTIIGFDADIVNAICAKEQLTCKMINAPFDSLIPSLQIGKYDVLFGGLGITPAREKVVSFSEPYYFNTAAFVASKTNPVTISAAGLKGKTVGVQAGSTFQQYMQGVYGSSVKLKPYASDMQALMDLQTGRVDAVMLDTPVANQWIQQHPKGSLQVSQQVTSVKYFGPGNGFAVQKGNTTLVNELNAGIDAIKADGTYAKIEKKYFG